MGTELEGSTAAGASFAAEKEPLPDVGPELAGALLQLVQRGYGGAEAAEALAAAGGGGGDDGPAYRGALEALFRRVLESAAPEAAERWPGSASAEARARITHPHAPIARVLTSPPPFPMLKASDVRRRSGR